MILIKVSVCLSPLLSLEPLLGVLLEMTQLDTTFFDRDFPGCFVSLEFDVFDFFG